MPQEESASKDALAHAKALKADLTPDGKITAHDTLGPLELSYSTILLGGHQHSHGRKVVQDAAMSALRDRNTKAIAKAESYFQQINGTWERAEQYFREMGILGPTSIEISRDKVSKKEELLGFFKVAGKWRICFGVWTPMGPDSETEWTPITECSSEVRVNLITKIPLLLQVLVESNERALERFAKAAEAAEDSLRVLRIK